MDISHVDTKYITLSALTQVFTGQTVQITIATICNASVRIRVLALGYLAFKSAAFH